MKIPIYSIYIERWNGNFALDPDTLTHISLWHVLGITSFCFELIVITTNNQLIINHLFMLSDTYLIQYFILAKKFSYVDHGIEISYIPFVLL